LGGAFYSALLIEYLIGFPRKCYVFPKTLPETNTPAYFAAVSVTKKKKFSNIETRLRLSVTAATTVSAATSSPVAKTNSSSTCQNAKVSIILNESVSLFLKQISFSAAA
jgi:hypothetical protein